MRNTKLHRSDILITLLGLMIIVISVGSIVQAYRTKDLEAKVEMLEQRTKTMTEPKRACNEYTIKQFRAGEAPEKCATEIYGDQF